MPWVNIFDVEPCMVWGGPALAVTVPIESTTVTSPSIDFDGEDVDGEASGAYLSMYSLSSQPNPAKAVAMIPANLTGLKATLIVPLVNGIAGRRFRSRILSAAPSVSTGDPEHCFQCPGYLVDGCGMEFAFDESALYELSGDVEYSDWHEFETVASSPAGDAYDGWAGLLNVSGPSVGDWTSANLYSSHEWQVWVDGPEPPEDCCGDPEPSVPGFEPLPPPPDPEPPEEPGDEGLPNCNCHDDTSDHKTLGELHAAIMDGLGFVDILGRGPQKTLCQMRCSVYGAINLGQPVTIATRTLEQIRNEVRRMTGFAAMPTSPPGYDAMVDAFINEAQQTLWKRLEMDTTGAPPEWLVDDGDPTTLDGAAVQMMAVSLVKAHYGMPDAAAYDKHVEAYLQGLAQRNTPLSPGQVDNALRRARYTVWNRAVALPAMAEDDDLSTIHFLPIELLAIAELKARLGHKDAEIYRRDYEKYVADAERRSPPDASGVVTRLLQTAQDQLYRQYSVLRTERFFSWPLTEGVRMYDLPDNQESCEKRLDPRKVTWVGVEKDGQWYPLICGIPPELYTLDQTSFPQRYEIRQCIEVWPRPSETEGRLVIKGHFKPEPFTEPGHRTTIDDEVVYLHALANAKAHYKQPDARNYVEQLNTVLVGFVAGSHHTRRYVPGARARTVEPEPVWTAGVWPPP